MLHLDLPLSTVVANEAKLYLLYRTPMFSFYIHATIKEVFLNEPLAWTACKISQWYEHKECRRPNIHSHSCALELSLPLLLVSVMADCFGFIYCATENTMHLKQQLLARATVPTKKTEGVSIHL